MEPRHWKSAIAALLWKQTVFNSPEELLRKIRLGEDNSLELKEIVFKGGRIIEPSRDKLAKELSSIANTGDCVVIPGVYHKTRDIIGISSDRIKEVERYVYEICNDSITPPVLFRSFRMEFPDSTSALQIVLKVEIPLNLSVTECPKALGVARQTLSILST